MTADGYFAGRDGSLDWVVPAEEQAKRTAEDIANFDTALFGRRTYEIFEGFWRPLVIDDAGTVPDPHNPGQRSSEHGTLAIALNRMTKLVFSRTLNHVTWRNSRVLHELDPNAIETMKRQPGKDMIVFGSGSIVSQLTQHGIIDEYQFVVCPILVGNGWSLLSDVSKSLRLDLLEVKQYQSGDVFLRYMRPT
jgi:dihydrofolate reductase